MPIESRSKSCRSLHWFHKPQNPGTGHAAPSSQNRMGEKKRVLGCESLKTLVNSPERCGLKAISGRGHFVRIRESTCMKFGTIPCNGPSIQIYGVYPKTSL